MARYIDADKLAKVYMGKCKDKLRLATVINEIELAPDVDVVPVVRCKDCKYAEIVTTNIGAQYIECQSHEVYMEADDFCSYGKRKSEETTP